MSKECIAGPFETERGYSPVIKTVGGVHMWVAGQTGHRGADGTSANRDIDLQGKAIPGLYCGAESAGG